MNERVKATQESYDRVADEYAARLSDELAHKPLDRALLDQLAAEVGDRGLICDLGCGPGHVAHYLHQHGVMACGIDLSPAMIAEARRLHPDIDFRQGNILDLAAVPAASFAAVVAFYSLIHIERSQMVAALREIGRVLNPAGVLLVAFHIGQHVVHLDDWWGRPVSLDFAFFTTDEMLHSLAAAGYDHCEVFERLPYADIEVATTRAYILARRAGSCEQTVIHRAQLTKAAT